MSNVQNRMIADQREKTTSNHIKNCKVDWFWGVYIPIYPPVATPLVMASSAVSKYQPLSRATHLTVRPTVGSRAYPVAAAQVCKLSLPEAVVCLLQTFRRHFSIALASPDS